MDLSCGISAGALDGALATGAPMIAGEGVEDGDAMMEVALWLAPRPMHDVVLSTTRLSFMVDEVWVES